MCFIEIYFSPSIYYIHLLVIIIVNSNIFAHTGYEDFNNSVHYVEFSTDKYFVEVAVPIVDDDIDEADEQVFIIFLEVVNATNLDNLNILENREISIGRIRDDESKYYVISIE